MTESLRWHMPSNSGYAEATFSVISPVKMRDEISFCINLKKVYGPGAVPEEYATATIDVVEYDVTLACVALSKAACIELTNDFDRWLNAETPFELALNSRNYQFTSVQVEAREGYITSSDKPLFELVYSTSGCELAFPFVVDQSCIRIAKDRLTEILSALG